jgi:hypothetical protein
MDIFNVADVRKRVESSDGYSKAWASFTIWVVGIGLMCACENADDADGAFHSMTKQYPNKNILVYDLASNTCIMQRLVA